MAETNINLDDETEEELSAAQLIVLIIFIIISFAIIGFLLWAGYNSWHWELALSFGALALLVTRIAKNVAKRVLSKTVDIAEIIAEQGEENLALEDVRMSPETRRILSRSSTDPKSDDEDKWTVWLFILLYLLMIFVAVFWYGMGMIFGLIFS